jgi:hypothetical protein
MLPDQHGRWVTRYSARGYPYRVWELPMPRLHDVYLECIVYMYRSKDEAMLGVNIGGSGFLVSVPCVGLPPPARFAYVVTNKHVANRARCARINTKDGRTDAFDLAEQGWISNDVDDLAIHLIPDISGTIVMFRTIPRHWLISEGARRSDPRAGG